uniref:Transmembrane protein n=1 Tax=Medicago truncatula TaxID=3880 RepID=A2Q3Y4_MEDTR|nr:hypothetical protein MtrDRAFT_AC155890g12v2 [Medicago truncatula]
MKTHIRALHTLVCCLSVVGETTSSRSPKETTLVTW